MTPGQIALDAFQRALAAGKSPDAAWEDAARAVSQHSASRAVIAVAGMFGLSQPETVAPKAPTMYEVLSDPARYAGTQLDPVLRPVPYQSLIGPGGFIQDHAEGDTWNPPHEPFHESDQNVFAPTPEAGGQAGLKWCDFYRGAPKSALHWFRLKLRDASGGYDHGQEFMYTFLRLLAPSQKRACGITI